MFMSPKGEGGFWPPEPQKKDTPEACLSFGHIKTESMPGEHGAPQGGAALLRRASVLGQRPKTLAQGEFTSPEHLNPKGEGGFWPPDPKKKDTPEACLSFWNIAAL